MSGWFDTLRVNFRCVRPIVPLHGAGQSAGFMEELTAEDEAFLARRLRRDSDDAVEDAMDDVDGDVENDDPIQAAEMLEGGDSDGEITLDTRRFRNLQLPIHLNGRRGSRLEDDIDDELGADGASRRYAAGLSSFFDRGEEEEREEGEMTADMVPHSHDHNYFIPIREENEERIQVKNKQVPIPYAGSTYGHYGHVPRASRLRGPRAFPAWH